MEGVYAEMLSRVQEDAAEHPTPAPDGFEYWASTAKGLPFRMHMRRPRGSFDGEGEELILDVNAVAATLPADQRGQCAVPEGGAVAIGRAARLRRRWLGV